MVDIKEGFIYFQGTDNALWRTNLDGSNSNHLGGFATASTPFVVTAANQPVTGTARPKYMVLTVIYSPPGTTPSTGGGSGEPSSSVIYGKGSSTGTTSTISSSFQKGIDIKASESAQAVAPWSRIGVRSDFAALCRQEENDRRFAEFDARLVRPRTASCAGASVPLPHAAMGQEVLT